MFEEKRQMVIFVGKQSEFNLVFNLCSTEKSENRKRKLGIWEFSIAKKVIFFFFFLPWVFLLSTYLQQGNHIILCLLSLIFFLSRRLIPSVLSTLVPAYYFPHEVYIMATLRRKTAFPSPSTFHFLTSFVTGWLCVLHNDDWTIILQSWNFIYSRAGAARSCQQTLSSR